MLIQWREIWSGKMHHAAFTLPGRRRAFASVGVGVWHAWSAGARSEVAAECAVFLCGQLATAKVGRRHDANGECEHFRRRCRRLTDTACFSNRFPECVAALEDHAPDGLLVLEEGEVRWERVPRRNTTDVCAQRFGFFDSVQ